MNDIELKQLAKEKLEKDLEIEALVRVSHEYEIKNEEHLNQALSMSLQARKLKSAVEKSRKNIVKPHIDFNRAVNEMAMEVKNKLYEIERTLTTKMVEWMQKEGKQNMVQSLVHLKVDDGALKTKVAYEYELVNINLVPSEFLIISLDDKKIQEAIKLGIRKIPGLEIKESLETSLRVKN